MNYLRSLTVLTISILMAFSSAFVCKAQDIEWVYNNWSGDKDEVFRLAKEQDKFIFLWVGYVNCGRCASIISNLLGNPEISLTPIIEKNYIPWAYKSYTNVPIVITDEYVRGLTLGIWEEGASGFPYIMLINPEYPDSVVNWIAGGTHLEYTQYRLGTLMAFVTSVNLLADSKLNWNEDEDEIYRLAKQQDKYIFKLVGSNTSPNSHNVVKMLNEEPLKQLLEENYILWYSDDFPEELLADGDAEDAEETVKTLPYISIIDPETPDDLLFEERGVPNAVALEEILKALTVSNENILPNHTKVSVWGNTLLISNQTTNEQITVYSLTGQNVTSVRKNDFTVNIDASKFPKGVLIIRSSAGWTSKVINQ